MPGPILQASCLPNRASSLAPAPGVAKSVRTSPAFTTTSPGGITRRPPRSIVTRTLLHGRAAWRCAACSSALPGG